MAGVGALWGCFCPPPLCPVRVQMLLPTVVEAVPVAVPCGHDGEPSPTVGNWPVPTEERSWNAKYSITRGILAFVRMRCPVQTGASQMRFQTWFLHLSGIEAQRDLTNRCLTRTCADTHRDTRTQRQRLLFCKATLILWCRHPPASFLMQTSLESVLLQFPIPDAREGEVSPRCQRGWDAGVIW